MKLKNRQTIRRWFSRGRAALVALAVWLVPLAAALAQDEDAPVRGGKSWVTGYLLVFLGVGLGLLIICRPGNRATEIPPRPE